MDSRLDARHFLEQFRADHALAADWCLDQLDSLQVATFVTAWARRAGHEDPSPTLLALLAAADAWGNQAALLDWLAQHE